MTTGDTQKTDRMKRFKDGLDEALKKGCGEEDGGLLHIDGGPWVPCPGCKDCVLVINVETGESEDIGEIAKEDDEG